MSSACALAIAPFASEHLKQLQQLERHLFPKNASWGADIADQLKRRNVFAFVASDTSSQKVQGYILFQIHGINCHVLKIGVVPEARRQGIGRRLMQAALAKAVQERRVLSSTLHVAVDNTAALGLYASLGYTTDSTHPDYYAPGKHAYKLIYDTQAADS